MFSILNLVFRRIIPLLLISFLVCRGIVLWNETRGGIADKALACLKDYKEMGVLALNMGIKEFHKAERIVLNSEITRSAK